MRPEDWIRQASPEALEEMARLLVQRAQVSHQGIVDSTIENAQSRCVARFWTVCSEFLSRARAEGDPIEASAPTPTFDVMVSASVPGRAMGPGADSFMDRCGLLNMLDRPEGFGESLANEWCRRVKERHGRSRRDPDPFRRALRRAVTTLASEVEQ